LCQLGTIAVGGELVSILVTCNHLVFSRYPHCFHGTAEFAKEFGDPIEVANKFSSYFSSIGPSHARKIQSPPCSHEDFLSKAFRESIFFNPTTKDEIITIAQSFVSGKAAGYDSIPMFIIKESIQIISEPLAHIINLSIAHGIVPDKMKIARVVPLFKAEDPSLFTNYRLVSILPSFFKILERIIYNRILDCLTNLHIPCDNHFGFRKKSFYHACFD